MQGIHINEQVKQDAQAFRNPADPSTDRSRSRANADADLGALGEYTFYVCAPAEAQVEPVEETPDDNRDFEDFRGRRIDIKTVRNTFTPYKVRCRNGEDAMADLFVFYHRDGRTIEPIGFLCKQEVLDYGEKKNPDGDHPYYQFWGEDVCWHDINDLF